MTYLIRDSRGSFEADRQPQVSQISYRDAATKPGITTLLEEQLLYDKISEARSTEKSVFESFTIVCANAIIWTPSGPEVIVRPISIENSYAFGANGISDKWKVDGGTSYTGSHAEMAQQSGWYVPVRAGADTQRLILYNPLTGIPLKTISFEHRDEAIESLVPYLQQERNVEANKAREMAEKEVSKFSRRNEIQTLKDIVHYKSHPHIGELDKAAIVRNIEISVSLVVVKQLPEEYYERCMDNSKINIDLVRNIDIDQEPFIEPRQDPEYHPLLRTARTLVN